MSYPVTKEQIGRFLVNYHHLTDHTQLTDKDQVMDYIRKVGCIQFDPLDVVGRNPDLVLQSRCPGYRKGDIEDWLYTDRALFDVWDKNMSICPVEDWSYFSRFRSRYLPWCDTHHQAIGEITHYLQRHEFACSSDFKMEDRVDWHYGPQRLAKAALECMCYAGLAVVHHKKGTRRYYTLAERWVPNVLFNRPDPNPTLEEYQSWAVLRRINSVGVLWNRPSDAWLGIQAFKASRRDEAFQRLLDDGKIIELQVEGMNYPLYIGADHLDLLQSVGDEPTESERARFLAPLDNLLWDRKLIKALFGFDYKWEVYTPAAQRKYGYYVLPVLCSDQWVGRIELATDKKQHRLLVNSFWREEQISNSQWQSRFSAMLEREIYRFAGYNLCGDVEIQCPMP